MATESATAKSGYDATKSQHGWRASNVSYEANKSSGHAAIPELPSATAAHGPTTTSPTATSPHNSREANDTNASRTTTVHKRLSDPTTATTSNGYGPAKPFEK